MALFGQELAFDLCHASTACDKIQLEMLQMNYHRCMNG